MIAEVPEQPGMDGQKSVSSMEAGVIAAAYSALLDSKDEVKKKPAAADERSGRRRDFGVLTYQEKYKCLEVLRNSEHIPAGIKSDYIRKYMTMECKGD